MRHARLLLVLPLLACTGLAQEPPYPDELHGTFQVAMPHVGDRGLYTMSLAQDRGDGFEEVGEPVELLRYEWLSDATANGAAGRDTPVHAVRVEHHDWTRAWDPDRHTVEDVFVSLDGASNIGVFQHEAGGLGVGDDFYPLQRTLMGGWGDIPCAARNALQGGFDLAADALRVTRCRVLGETLDGDYHAAARAHLGDHDTVVFHRERDGARRGEAWLWFTAEIPIPLAMIVQDTDMPMRFHVYRLTNFSQGDDPIRWVAPQPGLPWPEPQNVTWGRFGPPDPDGVAFRLDEAITAAREAAPDLDAWLEDNPAAYLAGATSYGRTIQGDVTTDQWYLSFTTPDAHASVWVDRVVTAGALPEAASTLLGLGGPAIEYDVRFSVQGCDCTVSVPLDVEMPSPQAARDRWELARSAAHEGDDALIWGFERRCADGRCETIDWSITAGRHLTVDNRSSGGSYEAVWSELDYRGDAGAGWSESMVLDELSTGESRPEAISVPPAVKGLADAVGLMQILRDTGALGAADDPTPNLPSTAPGVEPGEDTGITAVSVEPPGQDTTPTGIVAATAGAVTIGLLLWLVLSKGVLGGFFTRLERHRMLERGLRAAIHAAIEDCPGIHFNEIARRVGRKHGVVQHHVEKLVQTGLVEAVRERGFTTFFVTGTTARDVRHAAPAATSDVRRSILEALVSGGHASPGQLSRQLGVPPSTISYHLRRLEEAGLIHVAGGRGRARVDVTDLGERTWNTITGAAA